MNKEIKSTLKSVSVSNFEHANQFEISGPGFRALQSYNSLVVLVADGYVTLGRDWDYSNTTMKHVNHFLGYTAKEIRAKIKSGEFQYDETMK